MTCGIATKTTTTTIWYIIGEFRQFVFVCYFLIVLSFCLDAISNLCDVVKYHFLQIMRCVEQYVNK